MAHEWYDYACCEDKDCDVIGWDELTYDQNKRIWYWKSKRSGVTHVIHEDSVSPIDKQKRIRVSKDGQLHGCERNVAGYNSPPAWVAYCLYFPPLT